jgi:hypothetical protein
MALSPLKAGIPIGEHISYLHGDSSNLNVHGKGRPKQVQPRVFPEDKIAVLLRNAVAILQFHEGFVQELETITKPFGITVGANGGDVPPNSINVANLEKAIMAIAQKFTREVCLSPALLSTISCTRRHPFLISTKIFVQLTWKHWK